MSGPTEELLVHLGVAGALAATAFLVERISPKRAALAHLLWLFVLVRLVVPPVVDVPILSPAAPGAVSVTENTASPTELPAAIADLPLAAAEPALWEQPPWTPSLEEPEAFVTALLPEAADSPVVPTTEGSFPWGTLLWGIQGAGTLTLLILGLLRARRFHVALRTGTPADPELQALVDRLAKRSGLARGPRVLM